MQKPMMNNAFLDHQSFLRLPCAQFSMQKKSPTQFFSQYNYVFESLEISTDELITHLKIIPWSFLPLTDKTL